MLNALAEAIAHVFSSFVEIFGNMLSKSLWRNVNGSLMSYDVTGMILYGHIANRY